jgi:D-arabinose 1-dehydrogenase-like Zn-dependent alcohol dehydrogenase
MGLGVIPLIMGHEIAGEVAEVGSEVRGAHRATGSS